MSTLALEQRTTPSVTAGQALAAFCCAALWGLSTAHAFFSQV